MNVTQAGRSPERVRDELLVRCREERIEPPSDGRIDRMVRSALHRGEELLFSEVAARLPEPVRARLVALVEAVDDGDDIEDDDGSVVLASIRSDPGNVSLNTMLTEISKLEAVRAIGLPVGVFADIAPKVVAAWRGRAAVESPSHLRDHPLEVTLPLLAALLYCREREITDTLVELLISTVHRINARAEVKVTNGNHPSIRHHVRIIEGRPDRVRRFHLRGIPLESVDVDFSNRHPPCSGGHSRSTPRSHTRSGSVDQG